MKRVFFAAAIALAILPAAFLFAADEQPNLLIITVDDMNCDSVGVYGCKLPETTPNMDALAKSGLRFEHAHVQVGNCMPSRNVMWSGCYPHNNGVEGFYQVKDAEHPHLVDLMNKAGYFTAIRGKVNHSTPYQPYDWDLDLDTLPNGKAAHKKDAASYGTSTKQGIKAAQKAGKPFCLVVNISDPHKPFYAEGRRGAVVDDPRKPSRVFTPEEVPVPGFLFDDPAVRKELSHYYSSVRRADDCVKAVMDALEASGASDDTVVMFLSDHGMPLPFAKTQLYHHSTRTPLVVRWPGVTKAGAIDKTHMVSAVDFLPTLLDIADIEHPKGFDGRSFAPLLEGKSQEARELVFKEYNENAGGSREPMRGVQSKQYLYLFNPWSNGQRDMATATKGTQTYRRMRELAKEDKAIAARLHLIDHRVVEELYDVENDPDCLHNLIDDSKIDDSKHQQELAKLRQELESWMEKSGDPLLEVFRKRDDAEFREQFMQKQERESAQRRGGRRRSPRRDSQERSL